jgi:hypothetical protein
VQESGRPALIWGIDTVVSALPKRYLNALWSTEMYRYEYARTERSPPSIRAVRRSGGARAAPGVAAVGARAESVVDQVMLTRSGVPTAAAAWLDL